MECVKQKDSLLDSLQLLKVEELKKIPGQKFFDFKPVGALLGPGAPDADLAPFWEAILRT